MKKTLLMGTLLVALTALGAQQALAARTTGITLLVIPSRYTVVQFAFDVASKRSMYLLSYDRPAAGGDTRMYAWDKSANKWIEVNESDVSSGALFHEKPSRTVLVGDHVTLPVSVGAVTDPSGKAQRITSLNLVDIANGLDDVLDFSGSEWKWFAGRYGFTLDDRNSERRRWGRYGPRGGERAQAPRKAATHDDVVMPEAVQVPEDALRAPAVVEPAPEQQTLIIEVPTAARAAVEEKGVAAPMAVAEPAPPMEFAPVGADVAPEDK
ncbi:MAG: hypothetical protein O3B24_04530 [Verrucomicrobia bacterium]|nr:hypothetical protein [Verrucomicrobiota bacterium]